MIEFKSSLKIKNEKTNLVVGVFSDISHDIITQLDKALNKRLSVSLEEGLIPATINYKVPDEECDLNIVPNENIKQDLNIVMSNSLGFGGHNGCIIFKKYNR